MFRVTNGNDLFIATTAEEISKHTNCGIEYVTVVTSLQVPARLGPWTIEPEAEDYNDDDLSTLFSEVLEYAPRILKYAQMSEKDKIEQMALSLNLLEQGYYALQRNTRISEEEPFVTRFNYEIIRLNSRYFNGQMQVSDAIVSEAVMQGCYGAGLCFMTGKRIELEKQEK